MNVGKGFSRRHRGTEEGRGNLKKDVLPLGADEGFRGFVRGWSLISVPLCLREKNSLDPRQGVVLGDTEERR